MADSSRFSTSHLVSLEGSRRKREKKKKPDEQMRPTDGMNEMGSRGADDEKIRDDDAAGPLQKAGGSAFGSRGAAAAAAFLIDCTARFLGSRRRRA